MKRHVHTVVALLWIVLGAIGAVWSAYDMWRNRNVSGNVLEADGLGLCFFILSCVSGVALIKALRFSKLLLILSSSILALYCLSYVLMVGPEFGSGWLSAVLILLGFSVGSGFITLLLPGNVSERREQP
jgi:hypothetical protein